MTAHVLITPDELRAIIREAIRAELAGHERPREEWMTVAEAARRKGVSTSTIYRYIDQGLVKARGGDGMRREVLI